MNVERTLPTTLLTLWNPRLAVRAIRAAVLAAFNTLNGSRASKISTEPAARSRLYQHPIRRLTWLSYNEDRTFLALPLEGQREKERE